MIILVPLLLSAATLHGFRESQNRNMEKNRAAQEAASDYDYGITIADSESDNALCHDSGGISFKKASCFGYEHSQRL